MSIEIEGALMGELKVEIFEPTFPRQPPDSWKSYPRTIIEGIEFSPQPSDDPMFRISCVWKAICPYLPSFKRTSPVVFIWAVDFPGLRRNGSSSQIIDQAQDFPEQFLRHSNLG